MSGVRAMPRRAGEMAVVGAGQTQLWTGVREGSGRDRGVGGGGGEGGRWISSGGMEVGNSGVGSRSDETVAGKSTDTYQPKYTKGQRLVPL